MIFLVWFGRVCASSAQAKPGGHTFSSARQKTNIATDSGEVESVRDETFDCVDVPRKCACRFSGCPDTFGGILDGGLHLRMAGIAKVAEVASKVAGTDEEAINTFDGRDCFDFLQRGFAFQLH